MFLPRVTTNNMRLKRDTQVIIVTKTILNSFHLDLNVYTCYTMLSVFKDRANALNKKIAGLQIHVPFR